MSPLDEITLKCKSGLRHVSIPKNTVREFLLASKSELDRLGEVFHLPRGCTGKSDRLPFQSRTPPKSAAIPPAFSLYRSAHSNLHKNSAALVSFPASPLQTSSRLTCAARKGVVVQTVHTSQRYLAHVVIIILQNKGFLLRRVQCLAILRCRAVEACIKSRSTAGVGIFSCRTCSGPIGGMSLSKMARNSSSAFGSCNLLPHSRP
jgi:hypothetical protein